MWPVMLFHNRCHDAMIQRAGGRVCPMPHLPGLVVVLFFASLAVQGRLFAAWQSLDAESPQPGCRLRCREEPGATWSYGRILRMVDESPMLLSVRWENETEDVHQLVDLSNFQEVETMPSDPTQDLLEGLESAREQDLEEAEGADAVLFSLEDMQEELETFRWLSAEVMHQRRELEELEEENERMREVETTIRNQYRAKIDSRTVRANDGEGRVGRGALRDRLRSAQLPAVCKAVCLSASPLDRVSSSRRHDNVWFAPALDAGRSWWSLCFRLKSHAQ
eukprot:s994_g9.t1